MKTKVTEKILMTGNEAMGEAAIRAGCQFYAGYPITPQNELTAYMARRMREEKRVFIQAESEVAAINMVFGASAAGVRCFTSSSSPGISLKQEGISYMAGAQLPAVIINVMRAGPGLGHISSSQSDYFQSTRGGGHGDYFTPTFAPWSVQEAVTVVTGAFEVADYYRTPVLVLADAIIGQTMESMSADAFEKAKARWKKKLLPKTWALSGAKNRPANIIRSFFLYEGQLPKHNEMLRRKWEKIEKNEQRSAVYKGEDARMLIVAFGSQARIVRDAVDILRAEKIKVGMFRPVSLWPYPQKALRKAAQKMKKIFVIEQSLGQMLQDVRLSLPEKEILFFGKTGGEIPEIEDVVRFVKKQME